MKKGRKRGQPQSKVERGGRITERQSEVEEVGREKREEKLSKVERRKRKERQSKVENCRKIEAQ